MKDLSKAGLEANLDYWKSLAERHRAQRDHALRQVRTLQQILLEKTGKAYDGLDYLRDIQASASTPTWKHRLRNLMEAVRDLR